MAFNIKIPFAIATHIKKYSSTAALVKKFKAGALGYVSNILYSYPPTASTFVQIIDATSAQTMTNKTLTAPTITSPVVSGAGYVQVAVVDLAGAAWHTGNGTADYLSWAAPANSVILRVVVNRTTASTGAATADIGTTATNDHTNSDNLLDGLDIGAAAAVADNFGTPGTNGKFLQTLASAKWITFHANADPTGLVGKAYIYYMTIA